MKKSSNLSMAMHVQNQNKNFRFSTGIKLSSWTCSVYMYTEYFLIEIALFIFALEAVTHYIFTRNETFLLVVKEDLIMLILWRAAICMGLCSTFVKFNGTIRFPDISHL